jgi:hypothetical protein
VAAQLAEVAYEIGNVTFTGLVLIQIFFAVGEFLEDAFEFNG